MLLVDSRAVSRNNDVACVLAHRAAQLKRQATRKLAQYPSDVSDEKESSSLELVQEVEG
jgi:hypothetical protein